MSWNSNKKDQQVLVGNLMPLFDSSTASYLFDDGTDTSSIPSWEKSFSKIDTNSPSATSLEREKLNHQLTIDIFDRLLTFGNESDRPLFCQRLQTIWEEQGIFCQSYPTITNQILDLYKLHRLVQDKQGYLEITTNRGWKEISNVLGFGDSGSAAYSVKRNYVRLGLLAYECRFDRAGIDPRSVIELSEMPHTVKKRKRGNNTSSSTRRAIVKANQQQLQMLSIQHQHSMTTDDRKKSLTPPMDIFDSSNPSKYSSRYHHFSSSFRLTPQQMSINDLQRFSYILRAGRLGDSNKHLDTLLVWLSDRRIASAFNLKCLPGLFNAIMEQYLACLYELYGQSFLRPSSTNDCYVNWFLQSKLRVNDEAIGPISNQRYLESLFFGTRRYVLKRLMTKNIKPRLNIEMDDNHFAHDSPLITTFHDTDCSDNETITNCSSPSPTHDLFEYDMTSVPSSYSPHFIDDHEGNRLFNSRGRSRGRIRPRTYTRDTPAMHLMSSIKDFFRNNNHRELPPFRSTRQPSSIPEQASQNEIIDHNDRYHSIMTRCSCLSTLIRNLSFIEENEYLANDRRLLDILERLLNCHHQDMHQIFDYQSHSHQQYIDTCSNCNDIINIDDTQLEFIKSPISSIFQNDNTPNEFTKMSTNIETDDPLSCMTDCEQRQLMYLLDNTFITLSNFSTFIELRHCHSMTRYRFVNTIIHWILCSLSFANEPFISMIMEDKIPMISTKKPSEKKEQIYISPRQISLQILAKLCTNELNVDYILLDVNTKQLQSLGHALLSLMNSANQDDIDREYCLIIICSLCKRNRQLVQFFSSHLICMELIFNYLEFYEYNQQQYLIATLTSCCNATSSSSTIPINVPINHSIDMMIDSCIQLLVLFAPIKENNCLRLFEYKLVDMSSSIYFEQRILKTFADILYIIKS